VRSRGLVHYGQESDTLPHLLKYPTEEVPAMRRTGLLLTIIMLSLVVPFLISTESSVPLVADEGPDSDGKELTPRSSFAPASWSDYFYVSTIYDNIWGTINNFVELQDGDSGYSDFYEEATGVYWAFQQVFKFDCDAYLYGDIELQIRGYDYNFSLGWAGEDLKISWKDNLGDSYTYLGIITGTTPQVTRGQLHLRTICFSY